MERYRKLFTEDDLASQLFRDLTITLTDLLELDVSKQRLDSTHIFSHMATFGRVVANLGWTDIKLPRAVRAGESVRAVSVIGDKRISDRRPTQGIVHADTTAYGENDDIVCSFKRVFLIYKRGLGPYQAANY